MKRRRDALNGVCRREEKEEEEEEEEHVTLSDSSES